MNEVFLRNLLKSDDISDSTLKFYIYQLLKLYKDFDEVDLKTLKYDDLDRYFKNRKYTPNTIKNKLVSLSVYFQKLGIKNKLAEDIDEEIHKTGKIISDNYNTHELNNKEREQITTKEEFKKRINEFDIKGNPQYYNEYLTLLLYFLGSFHLLYPVRNDLANAMIYIKSDYKKIDKPSEDYNYILIDKPNKKLDIIMNKYKTKKTYGIVKYSVKSKELYTTALKLYNYLKSVDTNFLMIKQDGKKMSSNQLSKLFIKYFGMSTSMIRKMFLSEMYDMREMEDMSHIMGHSINTAINKYVKKV